MDSGLRLPDWHLGWAVTTRELTENLAPCDSEVTVHGEQGKRRAQAQLSSSCSQHALDPSKRGPALAPGFTGPRSSPVSAGVRMCSPGAHDALSGLRSGSSGARISCPNCLFPPSGPTWTRSPVLSSRGTTPQALGGKAGQLLAGCGWGWEASRVLGRRGGRSQAESRRVPPHCVLLTSKGQKS